MKIRGLFAGSLSGIGALGIIFLLANPALAWGSEVWEINGYIDWEFLNMDREVVFYEESALGSYPFVSRQKEYMEKRRNMSVAELRERFETSFTPLVIVAYRKKDLQNRYFTVIDITCESDSRIYESSQLGRFEYQYVNIPRWIGKGASFPVPPEVEYTSFWLLPAESLAGKVYVRGHTGQLVGSDYDRFRIELEQNELFLSRYIEQLEKRVDETNQRIEDLKGQSGKED